MKKSLGIHLAWLAIAAAAFAVGHYVLPPSSSTGDTAGDAKEKIYVKQAQQNSLLGKQDAEDTNAASSEGSASLNAADSAWARLLSKNVLSESDLRQGILDALREPNPLKSNTMFAQLLEKLTPDNIQTAFETVRENLSGPGGFTQMRLLTYAWGSMDPEKAIEYMGELDGRTSTFTTASVLNGWASGDPKAAVAWLESQEELNDMERAMYSRGLISGLAQTDLKAAMEYALAEEDPGVQRQYLDVIAREQIQSAGIEGAKTWLQSLPEGEARVSAYDTVANQYTRTDLDGAADWAASVASQPDAVRAVAEVADELTERNPSEALVWAQNLPAGEAQDAALRASFNEWARTDPESAGSYLNEMPDSPAKDQSVAAYASTYAREEPESASYWASTIQNAEVREETMIRVGQSWYRRDPDAATTWATTAGLSAEAQQAVTTPQSRGGGFDFRRGGGGGGPFGGGGGGGRGPGGGRGR